MTSPNGHNNLAELRATDLVMLLENEGIGTDVYDDRFEIAEQDEPYRGSIATAARARMAELLPIIKSRLPTPPMRFDDEHVHDFGQTITDLIRAHTAQQQRIEARGNGPDGAALRPLTDLGNAERLTGRYVGRIKYVIERGMYAVWDGDRWLLDDAGRVELMMKETARSIWEEVLRAPSPGERTEIAKHALRSENNARIQGALRLVQTEPGIPVHISDFDAEPFAINCLNGLLDLRPEGILTPHDPTMLVMKRVNVSYHANTTCPTWHRFLERVLPDPAVRAFVQRFVGYALTGSTGEQGFPIFYGKGANGKTTLLEVIGALLNDYAQSATMATFTEKRGDGSIPNDVARMVGARFVSAVETNENMRLNEGLIKQLTGGDRVTARFLHHEFFDFAPSHKLAISVNHRPLVRGTDHAIWRRIWLVPFTVTIPDAEQDKNLKQKLLAELPGIFAWAVAGCRAWQREGLNPPTAVTEATDAYRDEMDIVGNWITECCVVSAKASTSAKKLYESYTLWAEQSREHARSQKEWGAYLSEKDFVREHRRNGWYWLGLGLLSPDSGDPCDPCDPYSGKFAHEMNIEKKPPNMGHDGSHGSRDAETPLAADDLPDRVALGQWAEDEALGWENRTFPEAAIREATRRYYALTIPQGTARKEMAKVIVAALKGGR